MGNRIYTDEGRKFICTGVFSGSSDPKDLAGGAQISGIYRDGRILMWAASLILPETYERLRGAPWESRSGARIQPLAHAHIAESVLYSSYE